MLQFLNAFVEHDAPAMAFLGRTSAENGVPRHIMEIRFNPKSFCRDNAIGSSNGRRDRVESVPEFRCQSHAPLHDWRREDADLPLKTAF
jgi:hypothetical protein